MTIQFINITDIFAGELHGRSGSIQAALNLEISQEVISRFNIKLEGLNGQLPNLDLVNTVVRLCSREGIPPALHKRVNILYTFLYVWTGNFNSVYHWCQCYQKINKKWIFYILFSITILCRVNYWVLKFEIWLNEQTQTFKFNRKLTSNIAKKSMTQALGRCCISKKVLNEIVAWIYIKLLYSCSSS